VISLTKHEKYLILFLLFTALLGTGLLFYKKTLKPVSLDTPYSQEPLSQNEKEYSFPININTANTEELTILKGIGPTLASDIVAYRKKHGSFLSKEDLKKVGGIGPKKFDNIQYMIKVE